MALPFALQARACSSPSNASVFLATSAVKRARTGCNSVLIGASHPPYWSRSFSGQSTTRQNKFGIDANLQSQPPAGFARLALSSKGASSKASSLKFSSPILSRINASFSATPLFSQSRLRSTLAAPASFIDGTDSSSSSSTSHDQALPRLTSPAVAKWLYASASLVFFIVVVGGVTRLTESGLSITEWQPIQGILPPMSDEEWQVEWEKYRVTPEGVLMNSQLDMPAFKRIFYMEWAHRIAGRVLGVGFILPAAYFIARGKVSKSVALKLGLMTAGIGFQGFLGWYMVKSGLEDELLNTPGAVPRVSQYRLAAHLGTALLLYLGMLHTAIGISRDWRFAHAGENAGSITKISGMKDAAGLQRLLDGPVARRFGKFATVIGAMVLLTAVSGAFVAGLDAGLIYNEFPTMGGRIVPPSDELMDDRYAKDMDKSDKWWRNILENPTTVQFDHRALAITTFFSVLSLPFIATRPSVRRAIPQGSVRAAKGAMHAAILQVTLGISTLLYLVPVPLAAAHQAGSVVLLTAMMVLASSLRRPSKAAMLYRQIKSRGPLAGKSVQSTITQRVNVG